MYDSTISDIDAVASAQSHDNGTPRFHVLAHLDHPQWLAAAEAEGAGGVAGDIRLFLDAQLEAGDVLVDAAPGFGFIALSAATAPGGMPSIFAFNGDQVMHDALVTSARLVGGWIESFSSHDIPECGLSKIIGERLSVHGRVFLHCSSELLPSVLGSLTPLSVLGRLVACCVSDWQTLDESQYDAAFGALQTAGFVLYEMQEHHGEAQLFPLNTRVAEGSVIALNEVPTTSVSHESELAAANNASDSIFPVASDDVSRASLRPGNTVSPIPPADFRGSGFTFIAPFCRTGYGIVGAHLLREFLREDLPVAYFPLGAVDRSIAHVPTLDLALGRQGAFDNRAPSVRLSQQFDLALHVGRGAHIGFPIFELDRFQPSEKHHLERQDRLMVTCAWARDVLLENGVWRTPIDIVPLGVDRKVFHEHLASRPAERRDTVFMSVGKLERRKGQLEMLRAFESAFKANDSVRLVMVCHNPFVDPLQFDAQLAPFRASSMATRITIVSNPFATQHELALRMSAADCGVFPVRAEGWNLEALEMLSLGKSVIASDCTGHTAFLNADNARLVTIDALEESTAGEHRGRWAAWGDRQHEQLVLHFRAVHEEIQSGWLSPNSAGIETAKAHSWEASASAFMRSVTSA